MSLTNTQLIDIANNFGSPVYIYDASRISKQYTKLVKAFTSDKVKFFYACKALGNINILKIIKNTGCGLDTVSINEVKLGLQVGFAPKNIIFTPNCVAFDEIREAVELGVYINIDNIRC